jgi:hypothetical protein
VPAVDAHDQTVAGGELASDLAGKGCEAATVAADLLAIEPDGGGAGGRLDEQVLAGAGGGAGGEAMLEEKRAIIMGEFGDLAVPVAGHLHGGGIIPFMFNERAVRALDLAFPQRPAVAWLAGGDVEGIDYEAPGTVQSLAGAAGEGQR